MTTKTASRRPRPRGLAALSAMAGAAAFLAVWGGLAAGTPQGPNGPGGTVSLDTVGTVTRASATGRSAPVTRPKPRTRTRSS